MAVRWPQGGCWQGICSAVQKRELGVPEPRVRYDTVRPSRGIIRYSMPTSIEFTNSVRVSGSNDAPPQLAPPLVPGNSTVGFNPMGVYNAPNTAPSAIFAQAAFSSGVSVLSSSARMFWRV